VYHTLTYTSGVLYYLSTTVNPVLYHIMSHKFREAFKVNLLILMGCVFTGLIRAQRRLLFFLSEDLTD
jgi:hypothetical protein